MAKNKSRPLITSIFIVFVLAFSLAGEASLSLIAGSGSFSVPNANNAST
jgi:hypothetical protein